MAQLKSAPPRARTLLTVIGTACVGYPAAWFALRQGDGGLLTLVGALLMFGVSLFVALHGRRLQNNNPLTSPQRRHLWRFLPSMLGYVVVLFGSLWTIRELHPQGPLLWALAVAPALPIVGAIVAMGLYLVEETDEFLRAILVQSMLWGIGVVMVFCTAWGFLENVDVVPHMPLYLVFPMFCGCFGLAQPIVRRRYQ